MTVSRKSLTFAVRNVARWGDTDVLPLPLENHWFHDRESEVVDLLSDLDRSFDTWLSSYPVVFERVLAGVGYFGFRGVTHIDPLWNAYLLSLVVELGRDIESKRIPIDRDRVFSYRFAPDNAEFTLFDRTIGWAAFQKRAIDISNQHRYVLCTDISDFYSRVYHHRIDNALGQATRNAEAAKRILTILKGLSYGGVSYGLPIGGNAARLLAELLLNRTDRLLHDRGILYCRFVDDYYIFANSEEAARGSLAYLSEALLRHEGLSLQRTKTRLMTAEEFRRTSPLADATAAESVDEAEAQRFLKIRLSYDPYSPTADKDYEKLREELERFDIVGMLTRELRKSRVDEVLVRQLVKSVRYLDDSIRDAAVDSLVKNLEVLYPLFPTVALVIRSLLEDLSDALKDRVFLKLRELIRDSSHIFMVPANLAFGLRLLVHDPSEESDQVLSQLYNTSSHMLLRRDLILSLAKRRVDHRVADIQRHFATVTPWERRALVVASYVLGDEGAHWRTAVKLQLSSVDQAFMQWAGDKNNGAVWEIPL